MTEQEKYTIEEKENCLKALKELEKRIMSTEFSWDAIHELGIVKNQIDRIYNK